MKLGDLVPPPELCEAIPEGCFADSAFVWCGDGTAIWRRGGKCYLHQVKCGTKMYPAPTLAEILNEGRKESNGMCVYYKGRGVWAANGERQYDHEGLGITGRNSATAALKLWLELKGIEA